MYYSYILVEKSFSASYLQHYRSFKSVIEVELNFN